MAAETVPGRIQGRSRLYRIRHGLTGPEWARAGGMAAVVVGLHVVGWLTLIVLVVPGHYSLGAKTFGVGIGFTAYTLGMRHAFDADHISAIDNTTRKLMADGQRPMSVGLFFSLGHSTIVFALALLLSLGVKALASPVRNDSSGLHQVTNVIGTGVSGAFLYIIAAINLIVLVGILRVFRDMRRGVYDEAALEEQLNSRGFMNRIFGRLMKSIRKPWQMYPVGVLFGLGFDTASEVALLVLAGTGAASGLPWYAILCLPVLFAAGMSLLGLIASEYDLGGPFWGWVSGLNLNTLGFIIVGLFVATWAAALLVWRMGRIEERWNVGMRQAPDAAD